MSDSKTRSAILLAAASIPATSFLVAPSAQAEVCGEVGFYVRVGGCTDLAGDAVDAAVVGAAVDHPLAWGPLPPGALAYPAFHGEAPCFLPDGQPYYTPGTEPCFPV
jgi:hypothetical protein